MDEWITLGFDHDGCLRTLDSDGGVGIPLSIQQLHFTLDSYFGNTVLQDICRVEEQFEMIVDFHVE